MRVPESSRRWMDVVTEMGLPGLHFHDLRHTGNSKHTTVTTTRARQAHWSRQGDHELMAR
ncbi:hypothetical protein GCM10009733_110270 [Nonomuraea maheshkhaliensis]|uniref:Tyr recombinase domain-containing protein n=1 Tax=Nonomuraea maheshkhaliensis TaxID=419590 RepID=A0ABP4U2A9_9ACTN